MNENNITALELQSFLQGKPLASSSPSQKVTPVEDISSWLKSSLLQNHTAPALQRLVLLNRVVSWAQGVHKIVRHLLSEVDLQQIQQSGHLVRKKYYSEGTPMSVQNAMFSDAPLGVLLSMIDKEQVLQKATAQLRRSVVYVLETAMDKDLSIGSAELYGLLLNDQGNIEADKIAKEALQVAKSLKRLVYIVQDPDDLVSLYDYGVRSAHDIARLQMRWFVDDFHERHKVPRDRATRLHNHAATIDRRNEETWACVLQDLGNNIVAGNATPSETTTQKTEGAKTHNLTDMFNLQFNDCEECCSVTGISAYLQDLMSTLQAMKIPSHATAKDGSLNKSEPKDILEVLLLRRPDLAHLELSCANATNILPYMAIVLEILESYITNLPAEATAIGSGINTPISIQPFNEASEFSSATRPLKPGQNLEMPIFVPVLRETDKSSIWQTTMASQMFPMTTFPYSNSGGIISLSLELLGFSISKIVNIFSDATLLTDSYKLTDGGIAEADQKLAVTKAIAHTQACAALGLTADEFLVITGHHPHAPLDLGSKVRNIRPTAHRLWGYASAAKLLDTDETSNAGLCFVRSQLLIRAGLDFSDLVEVLQTLYFSTRLVLVNAQGSTSWTEDLSTIRLRVLDTAMATSQNSTDEPATKPLTEEICFELQSFLRLRSKLGWSIANLDAAISILSCSRVSSGESPADYIDGISASLLCDISALDRLAKVTGISVPELLPLWGTISTHNWSNSLYRKLFCTQALRKVSNVFEPVAGTSSLQPQVLEGDETMQKHQKSLQVAFDLTKDDLIILQRVAGSMDSFEFLTLRSLSSLYRYKLLCRILSVTPGDLEKFLAVLPAFDPFIDPYCTLGFVELWLELYKFGWSLPTILTIITKSPRTSAESTDSSINPDEGLKEIQPVVSDTKIKALLDVGLDAEDIKCLHGNQSPVQLNLDAVQLADLRSILNWQGLCQTAQRHASEKSGPYSFHTFLKSLVPLHGNLDVEALATQLADTMGWSAKLTTMVLKTKYSHSSTNFTNRTFLGPDGLEELSSLRNIMEYLAPLDKNPKFKPSLFFDLATMRQLPDNAYSLQECLSESQKKTVAERMRERKRRALVDYLLQLEHIRALGIANSDGLFEYFLIDVQMGSELETTRTKQAVSTVQLFAQRCLLGREVSNHIRKSYFKQKEWAWRQRHSVWQATRRIFLYPENWLEPTLRDSKTNLFRAYEESITAQDLSWDTFVSAIKKYVSQVAAIADLEIVAYLCEDSQGTSSRYHLFARSRNAPYSFFYRRLEVDRTSSSVPQSEWTAWSPIEVDIPVYETDWNDKTLLNNGVYLVPVVRKNRLFVLIPQVSVKTSSAPFPDAVPNTPITVQGLGSKTVDEMTPVKSWEVRLAWSEFRDGKWTAKQLSQTALPVAPHPQYGVPSIENFAFVLDSNTGDGDARTEVLETKLEVGYWCGPRDQPTGVQIGYFAIRDDRTTSVCNSPPDIVSTVLPTTFHKYSWTDSSIGSSPPLPPGEFAAGERPLLAVPYRDGRSQDVRKLTWSLSYGGDFNRDVTGMVVDEVYGNGGQYRGATIFMWPSSKVLSRDVKSDKVADNCHSSVMIHGNATRILEASCEPDGLARIYDCVDEILKETRLEKQLRFKELQKSRNTEPREQDTMPEKRMPFSLDYGRENWGKYIAGRNEVSSPYAIYNWELGFHTIALAVDRFLSTQQFDLALRATKLVFDPTGDSQDNTAVSDSDNSSQQPSDSVSCWRFAPFQEVALNTEKMKDSAYPFPKFKPDKASSDLDLAMAERRSNPLNAHGTARGRTQAYMKWIVFRYIEILVKSGDSFFRQRSLETLPLAIQRYVEASYVLGPTPPRVPKLAKARAPLTFATFSEDVDLELEFPFTCLLSLRGDDNPASVSSDPSLLCLLRTTYFSLPPNPKYQTLRSLVEDRLYKARNNLDISGKPIFYSIDEPYLDPIHLVKGGLGAKGDALGLDPSLGGATPIPFARFQILTTQAFEMCNELRAMMDQLLSVREKRDGEALALLRLQQDRARHILLLGLKKIQRDEINISLDVLKLQRDSSISQLTHYLRLLGEENRKIPDEKTPWQDLEYTIDKPTSDHLRMSRFEELEMASYDKAAAINESSAARDGIISILRAFPETSVSAQPMGVGMTSRVGISLYANALEIKSRISNTESVMALNEATRAGRMNSLTRQLQERVLQANMKGREIESLNKQIVAQQLRIDLNEKEVELQKKEQDWTQEVQTWYEQKYSTKELYSMMEKDLQELSFTQYNMAFDLARRAESAFAFERKDLPGVGESQSSLNYLCKDGYWKAGGQFAAQQMAMDLRRMQVAYIERPSFDYQVTKAVSLRQLDPMALINLRESGTATFSLPETLFDIDYPGHYMRRLKSVSVSIPAIVGPYTTIAGTLTLMEHSYRVTDQGVTTSKDYMAQNAAHFRRDVIPLTSVAISSGIQESGMFDLSFTGQQLGPFEGAGAVSSWKFELQESEALRQFDYRTISDLVLHLHYTSLSGGPGFKKAATEAAVSYINGYAQRGLFAMFDLQADFYNEWYMMQKKRQQETVDLPLRNLVGRMPFWAKGKTIRVRGITVVVLHGSTDKNNNGNYGQSIKLYPKVEKATAWESVSTLKRATLLANDQIQGVTLGDDWRLELPGGADINELLLVLQYSI